MLCKICGSEFVGKRSDSKYCSRKCSSRAETIVRTKKRQDNLVIESKICPVCGETFIPDKYSYKHQLYCSKECTTQMMNENAVISGRKKINAKIYRENHSEKISEHDLNYKNEIRYSGNRYKILERDNYTCQMCGNTNNLVVHHIDNSGQSDNVNNDVDNLTTLCRRCHINIHKLISKH